MAAAASRRQALAGATSSIAFVSEGSTTAGSVAVFDDPWASEQLQVSFGRTTLLVTRGSFEDRLAVGRALLAAVIEAAADADIDVLSLRIPGDDAAARAVAQQSGFVVSDVELTYLGDASRARRPVPDPDRPDVAVTVAAGGRPLELDAAEAKQLLDRAARMDRGHLVDDVRMPAGSAARFYRAWTANVLDGAWGDRIAVARRRGRVVGVFAWVLDRALAEAHGVSVFNQSWGLVAEEGRGALSAMTAAILANPGSGIRWTECETSVANRPMNQAIQRLGVTRSTEVSYVLHAWIDRQTRRPGSEP